MAFVNARLLCVIFCLAIAGTLGAVPRPAIAADGNQFLAQCTKLLSVVEHKTKLSGSVKDAYGAGYCTGVAIGVTHTIVAYDLLGHTETPIACLPKAGIQNGQAIRIIVKYLKEHPEGLHRDAVLLSLVALGQAFPCKPGSGDSG